jgi:hypothetical protein
MHNSYSFAGGEKEAFYEKNKGRVSGNIGLPGS